MAKPTILVNKYVDKLGEGDIVFLDRAGTGFVGPGNRGLMMLDMERLAEEHLVGVGDGIPLDAATRALLDLGVKVSVTCLDRSAIDQAIDVALAAGCTSDQVQEAIALISGLGVHSLMMSAAHLLAKAAEVDAAVLAPYDDARKLLWDRHVGDDPYWHGFEREFPGFLDALLRLSPLLFRRFHDYCAVPWQGGTVRAVTKELLALAADSVATHQFLPGFRLHLRNALKLGAGRLAILDAVAIAVAAPPPHAVS